MVPPTEASLFFFEIINFKYFYFLPDHRKMYFLKISKFIPPDFLKSRKNKEKSGSLMGFLIKHSLILALFSTKYLKN